MKGLVKGILAIGTAIAVGCVIYKKVKEDKQNKEEVIIEEETQELTDEQQEIHDILVEEVKKQMKPYMRRVNILRFARVMVGMFITANIGVYLACLEADRRVNGMKEGVVAC